MRLEIIGNWLRHMVSLCPVSQFPASLVNPDLDSGSLFHPSNNSLVQKSNPSLSYLSFFLRSTLLVITDTEFWPTAMSHARSSTRTTLSPRSDLPDWIPCPHPSSFTPSGVFILCLTTLKGDQRKLKAEHSNETSKSDRNSTGYGYDGIAGGCAW